MPEMLLGYRMDVKEAEKTFVWPMEKVVDGKRVRVLFPKNIEDDTLAKLREHGAKRIWVTPKIPFIIPIFVGTLVAALVGTVFFYMFDFILGSGF